MKKRIFNKHIRVPIYVIRGSDTNPGSLEVFIQQEVGPNYEYRIAEHLLTISNTGGDAYVYSVDYWVKTKPQIELRRKWKQRHRNRWREQGVAGEK